MKRKTYATMLRISGILLAVFAVALLLNLSGLRDAVTGHTQPEPPEEGYSFKQYLTEDATITINGIQYALYDITVGDAFVTGQPEDGGLPDNFIVMWGSYILKDNGKFLIENYRGTLRIWEREPNP